MEWKHFTLDLWNTSCWGSLLHCCRFTLIKTGSDLSAANILITAIWSKKYLYPLLAAWDLWHGSQQSLRFHMKPIDTRTDITAITAALMGFVSNPWYLKARRACSGTKISSFFFLLSAFPKHPLPADRGPEGPSDHFWPSYCSSYHHKLLGAISSLLSLPVRSTVKRNNLCCTNSFVLPEHGE